MSWLPPRPSHEQHAWPAWLPEDVGLSADELSHRSYVVVEELTGPRVSLTVTRWPGIDDRGRLIFPGPTRGASVDRAALRRLLGGRRRVARDDMDERQTRAAQQRPVEVGDVYVAVLDAGRPGRLTRSAEELFQGELIDVTAQAREAAQASFSAAVARPLRPEETERLIELAPEDETPAEPAPLDVAEDFEQAQEIPPELEETEEEEPDG